MNTVFAQDRLSRGKDPAESQQERPVDCVDEHDEEVRERELQGSAPLYLGRAGTGDCSPLDGNGRGASSIRSFQGSYGNMATLRCFDYFMQKKVKVGEADDLYEREANRIAEQVLKIPEPAIQRKPT